ncbi:MAG: hypothetical protein KC645_00695, partial [Gemmatimonadetes bacterium]|nr:hypothetical protein [Gemmatimonadota bacterium]
AIGLVTLALDAPALSLGVTLAALVLAWVLTPSLLTASRLGRSLAWSRSWGSLVPFQWTDEGALAPAVREILAAVDRPFGKSLRVAGCARLESGRRRSLRAAWLVSGADTPLLLVRRGRRSPVLEALPLTPAARLESEALFVRLRLRSRPFLALVFPRAGPSRDALEVEVERWGVAAGNPSLDRV